MDLIFSALFKYRYFYFEQGAFGFESSLPVFAWLLIATLFTALLGYLYLVRQKTFDKPTSMAFFTLRLLFVSVAVFVLAQPSLTLSRLVPQQTSLAVLFDNSKSMGIIDGEQVRGEPLKTIIREESDLIEKLRKNFQVDIYQFGGSLERLPNSDELNWQKDQTSITHTLEQILSQTQSVPMGGIVLFSDGAENSFRDTRDVLNQLSNRRIPLHTVGLGPDSPQRDLELESVSLPRKLLPGSAALARVSVRYHGFEGEKGRLEVREDNTLVESREIQFPRNSNLFSETVRLMPQSSGIKTYEFKIVAHPLEKNQENNSRSEVMDVRDTRPRLLYVEGRPRWEYKFLRRALVDDDSLQLESLLRTALNKYYRQGIEDETTLASGFPDSREQLFEYHGLLIGDVESAFFSYNQMELIRDFVSERGGGLLMLGGGSTLSAGGFQNTPIEESLPVWLDSVSPDQLMTADYQRAEARTELTQYGSDHPALQLALDSRENNRIWSELPPITDRNLVKGLKPGATVLAEVTSSESSPLLVSQRFGRGLSLVFLSGSSWRWQMLQSHDDLSHETFWKQLLRWLVAFAVSPVSVELDRSSIQQNEPVNVRVVVHDKGFNRINDANVTLSILTPSGGKIELEPQLDTREGGVYVSQWAAREDGLHRIKVTAQDQLQQETLGESDSFFLVSSGKTEYFNATQKREYLKDLSEQSGGRYYSIDEVSDLPEEILYTESQASVTQVLDLWNMPINLILLLLLPFLEWGLRRRKGII